MEARLSFAVHRMAAVLALLGVVVAFAADSRPAAGAGYRTQFFLVTAPTADYAREVAETAERLRKELAVQWLGHELPPWRDVCPIEVVPASGAGGVTQFYFDRGQPYGWTMRVQGSRERVLDSVLPHEITHTVFATHFGRPLPRWADEGACTTTEDISERRKQEKLLNDFLRTNRGIPFNRMFEMTEYPSDVLPLYAQGYSLARFLIALEGKPQFISFVGDGAQDPALGTGDSQALRVQGPVGPAGPLESVGGEGWTGAVGRQLPLRNAGMRLDSSRDSRGGRIGRRAAVGERSAI